MVVFNMGRIYYQTRRYFRKIVALFFAIVMFFLILVGGLAVYAWVTNPGLSGF